LRRALGIVIAVAVFGLLALVPKISLDTHGVFSSELNSPGTLQLLGLMLVFGGVALTYDLLFGFTGLLSFGHALYFAVGVYLTAIGTTKWDWSLPKTLAFTALVGLVLPLVLGAVSLRVSGIVGVLNTKNLYWLALAYLVVVFVIVNWAVDSSPGRVWQAIRENERRVEVLGLQPFRFKLVAFVLSAFLATAGGVVYVLLIGGATPQVTTPSFTLALLLMVVIGGTGTRWGAVLGGIVYTFLDNRLLDWSDSQAIQDLPKALRIPLSEPLFVLGTLFILLVYFLPGGLAGLARLRPRRGGVALLDEVTTTPGATVEPEAERV
jgi:branched-chain amino acid transport system permease protein